MLNLKITQATDIVKLQSGSSWSKLQVLHIFSLEKLGTNSINNFTCLTGAFLVSLWALTFIMIGIMIPKRHKAVVPYTDNTGIVLSMILKVLVIPNLLL